MGRGVFINWPYNWTLYACTQATTAAPAIGQTLFNGIKDLQSAPTLGRTGTGVYTITAANSATPFTANKTRALITFNGASRVAYVTYTSTSVITITVFDVATPSAADSGNFDLEIQIYD